MTRIGLISDTHGYLDPKVFHYFDQCDEIWHAGDFGNVKISESLSEWKKLKGVYGNIDGQDIRAAHPLMQQFTVEGMKIMMVHIGGYPGRYDTRARAAILSFQPDIFVCGHSHILKVMKDRRHNDMLTLNPGAAGVYGLHKIRTLLRFSIDGGKALNLEAIELGLRGQL